MTHVIRWPSVLLVSAVLAATLVVDSPARDKRNPPPGPAARPRLVVQLGHQDDIECGAFSADGGRVLTGGSDGFALLWDVATGRELLRVRHGAESVHLVRFGTGESTFLTGSHEGTFRIWNAVTGERIGEFANVREEAPRFTVFSPDLRYVLAADAASVVRYTDLATGNVLFESRVENDEVTGVHITTGNRAIVELKSLRAIIWDGTLRTMTTGGDIYGFSPGGRYVAIGVESEGERKRRLGRASDEEGRKYVLENPMADSLVVADAGTFVEVSRSSNAFSVAFSPDERFVAVEAIDTESPDVGSGLISVRETATGAEVRKLRLAQTDVEESFRLSFSGDGRSVRGVNDKVCIWDVSTGELVTRRELAPIATGRVDTVEFSPGGDTVLVGQQRGMQQNPITEGLIVDLRGGQVARRLSGLAERARLVGISDDNARIAAYTASGDAFIWNTEMGGLERAFRWRQGRGADDEQFNQESYASVAAEFAAGGGTLLVGNDRFGSDGVTIADLEQGAKISKLPARMFGGPVISAALNADGSKAACIGGNDTMLFVVDLQTRKVLAEAPYPGEGRPAAMRFDPDGNAVFLVLRDGTRLRFDPVRRSFDTVGGSEEGASISALSGDGKTVAIGTSEGRVKIYDVGTGELRGRLAAHAAEVKGVGFSASGKEIGTVGRDGAFRFWRKGSGTPAWEFPSPTFARNEFFDVPVVFSPGGDYVAVLDPLGELLLFETAAGKIAFRERDFDIRFLADGEHAITETTDGSLRLVNLDEGRELCRLIALADGTWIVVDPEGRFDTNNLDEVKGLHWIAPDAPYAPAPVEIFMRDYYEPRLMARLLSGERFAPVRDLTGLDRRQPGVKIEAVTADARRPGTVAVRIDIEGASGTTVNDLRLFRDGQLVAVAPENGGKLETDATGRTTVTFENIRLPRRANAKTVEFSAYAFNGDRVKSVTSRRTYTRPETIVPVKGRAYVVSIGVNGYEDERLNLRFAVNDAKKIQSVLGRTLLASGQYSDVVTVVMVSEAGSGVATHQQAAKKSIKAVIDLLAGRTADPAAIASIPNAAKLKAARPEDLVLISFSGHGYADARGAFYLVPFDTGDNIAAIIADGARTGAGTASDGLPSEVLARFVSSDELSDWMRDVDAGDFVFVVDACQSAASVAGAGFKPGPMGSRGLGQLAYDKGMRILAATQADNVAIETKQLRHGILTYALVREGIEAKRADVSPKDLKLTVAEWLGYGVERVPGLFTEIKAGKVRTFGPATEKTLVLVEGDAAAVRRQQVQRPSLFDFSRRKRDVVLGAL